MSKKKPGNGASRKEDVQVLERTKKPQRYKVILHNDDFTPRQFVIQLLEVVFNHSPSRAAQIMMTAHRSGIGVAGIYPYEIAEAKTARSNQIAREVGYPLMMTVEPE